MAKVLTCFFVLIASLGMVCHGQEMDTLVFAEGQIINADTKEPVMARISYSSLPYGNRVGSMNNTTYSFPMFDNEKYAILVEAPGFIPAKYMLDPAAANERKRVIQHIELKSGVKQSHTAGHVMRLDNVIFQLGKSKISPESYQELQLVVKMMNENKNMIIQLEGHTDYQGNARDNLKLSQDRVDAVKDYLTSNGISKNRIKTKAFGGTMPLSRDETPEGHSLNRRVELRILSN